MSKSAHFLHGRRAVKAEAQNQPFQSDRGRHSTSLWNSLEVHTGFLLFFCVKNMSRCVSTKNREKVSVSVFVTIVTKSQRFKKVCHGITTFQKRFFFLMPTFYFLAYCFLQRLGIPIKGLRKARAAEGLESSRLFFWFFFLARSICTTNFSHLY